MILLRKAWATFLLSVFLIAIIINIITIYQFPSWFDEAFFANVAYNFNNNRGIYLDIIPGSEGYIYTYGPLYFFLQSSVIELVGMQALWFRLPNFLAAYLTALLLGWILRSYGVGRAFVWLFVLLVVVDVSFNRNLVGGRMDMVAVLLVAVALCAARLRVSSVSASLPKWFAVGAFSATAFLTTPRSLFLLPVVFVIGVHQIIFQEKHGTTWQLIVTFLAAAGFVLPVFFWIQGVGGLQEYFMYPLGNETVVRHIAPSFFRSYYDNVAIVIMLIIVISTLNIVFFHPLSFGLFLTYVSFSLFVREVGPYAGMIMPFVLALIVYLVARLNVWQTAKYGGLLALALPGLVLIGVRGVDLQVNFACRDETAARTAINQVVLDGRRIVAPFKYYFLVEGVSRDVITFERTEWNKEQVMEGAEVVIADENEKSFLEAQGFREQARIECKEKRVWGLPGTFYKRSIFNEVVFEREVSA